MNGDILTDLNYAEFHDTHVNQDCLFTISSQFCEQVVDYGVLETNRNRLSKLTEKPKLQYEVSMGVYMVSRKVLDYLPDGKPYGFDDLMQSMITDSKSVEVSRFDGYWLDIGRPDDYVKAIDVFDENKQRFLKVGS